MLKKLFLVIAITVNIIASEKELIKDINTVYAEDFYNKFSNYTSLPLNNFENNATQKKIKEDFEKILPRYLNNKSIFSKSSLKKLKIDKVENYKIRTFISVSLSYIKYLDSRDNYQLSLKIMRQNLINLNDLMINSKNMIDYLIALGTYSKIFSNYHNPSLEIVELFKKHPPANKSIYFKKVEAEKMYLLKMIDDMNNVDEINMEDYDTSDYKKLMIKVRDSAKSDINKYFSKILLATNQSKIDDFNKYIKVEGDKLMSTWNQVKFMFHSILSKILQIFIGYNSQHDYVAIYMGKILAIVAVPRLVDVYGAHIRMEQTYETLLSKQHD